VTRLPVAYLVVSGLVLLWDVFLAGQIAQLRRAPRPFTTLTALCGLFVAPALIVAVTTSSLLFGRAVSAVAWLWPLTLLLFAAQAVYATTRRFVTVFVGVPIAAYNVVLAVVALTDYVLQIGGNAPEPLVALSAAHATVLGSLLGRAALVSPLAVQLPLLGPAFPARWRLSATVRGLLAVVAAVATGLTLLELPRGFGAVRSYGAYASDRVTERPSGDFLLGLKLLPDVSGLPPALAFRYDLALADTIGVQVVNVVVTPSGARAAPLDSLTRALEEMRRDSTLIMISLGYDAGDAGRLRADPRAYLDDRLDAIERIARRVRPNFLVPAVEPYGEGMRALGRLPIEFWRGHLSNAARRAHSINERIRVGVAAAEFDAADSALYAWGADAGSPMDVVGFAIHPSLRGASGVDARLRAAERWIRASSADGGRGKPHWVFAASGFPAAHGDASQERAILHTLAWATSRAQFRGLIVAEPGDYYSTTGLRAANGRFRRVVPALARASRGLQEAVIR
jgi:hypothetical protein